MAVTQAQTKATEKYLKKFDEIKIRIPKGKKEEYKCIATKKGKSMNQFIIECIEKEI